MRHNSFALTGSQDVRAKSDNAARRYFKFYINAVAQVLHRGHFAFTARDHINHLRGKLFRDVDGQLFDRLAAHAVNLFINYLRLTYLQLIAFAAHRLDQNGQVKHAAAGNNPFIGRRLLDAQRKIFFQLVLQAIVDVARSAIFALLTKKRRIIDRKEHRHSRLVDRNRRQGLRTIKVANSIADFKIFKPNNGTDVATTNAFNAPATHSLKGVQLFDLDLLHRTIAMSNRNISAIFNHPAMHAPYGNATRIIRVVERSNKHLQRPLISRRRRNCIDNCIEQISNILRRLLPVLAHPVVFSRTIDYGEVQLLLRSVEIAHQVEDHLVNLLGAAIRFVHLIDDNDRLQANLQSLLQDESRLRHRSFKSIDQKQTAIGHIQNTLYLSAEVRVARRVYNVDFSIFIVDGDIFGEDRYTSLALQFIIV